MCEYGSIQTHLQPEHEPQQHDSLRNASCLLGVVGSGSPVGVLANEMGEIGRDIHQEQVDDERVSYDEGEVKPTAIEADLAFREERSAVVAGHWGPFLGLGTRRLFGNFKHFFLHIK